MNKLFFRLLTALLAVLLLAGCGAAPAATGPQDETTQTIPETTKKEAVPVGSMMRHMSYNILGTETYPGFDNEEKRGNIKSIIEEIDPDTFGVQEAAQAWTDGLVDLLDGKYAMAGGHSDPKVENAPSWTNAIFYKVDKFNYLDSGIYFLNGDGAFISGKATNNCPFVLLERKEDGALLLILNVHLQWLPLGCDDLRAANLQNYGIETADTNILRDNQVLWSGKFATEKAEAYAAQYGKPVSVLLSGDFNIDALLDSLYEHEYTRMTEMLNSFGLTETAVTAKELVTNQNTTNWVTYRKSAQRLDYIFTNSTILPEVFTVHSVTQDWQLSSDHLPVYLDYYIGQ